MLSTRLQPEQIASRVSDLPPLPEVVSELLVLMRDEALNNDILAEKLARDPALSIKALRLANSSFYGLSRQIQSVPEALRVLGSRTVGLMVLAAAATDTIKVRPDTGFQLKPFWRHALGAALSGQSLARTLSLNPDLGFTVGLLHDIGQIAIVCIVPDQYHEVLAYQQASDCMPIEAERAVLGTDHAEIGALVAERWHLAPGIVEAIAQHHAPTARSSEGLVGMCHLADAISHAMGLSGDEAEAVPPTPPEVWSAVAPSNAACLKLFAEVESQFDGVCQALGI